MDKDAVTDTKSKPMTLSGSRASNVAGFRPRVWLISAYRAGEQSQLLALGEALGWPYRLKRFKYRKCALFTNLFRGSDLDGIVRESSSPLQPPWPDLLLAAGMRNEPVCRWIRNQAGGRVRIVHVGRPWAALKHFDLVITTPQYQLPRAPNLLLNDTTLHRLTEQRLLEEKAQWGARLQALPEPRIAVILGGNSGPYTLGPKAALRLAGQIDTLARERGGSLMITSSARTAPEVIVVLKNRVSVPYELFEWTPGCEENPYFGFLALADSIVVTGDSISMLTEACSLRKPVYMFDLGEGALAMRWQGRYPLLTDWRKVGDFRWSALAYLLLMRLGPRFRSRDIRLVHQALLQAGRLVWLGDSFPDRHVPPPLRDKELAVERVRALFVADH